MIAMTLNDNTERVTANRKEKMLKDRVTKCSKFQHQADDENLMRMRGPATEW